MLDKRPGKKVKKILLVNKQSPGDVLVMTGAIHCLHEQYPGEYLVGVETSCNAIFENSPQVSILDKSDPTVQRIDMSYPLINQSNQRPVHFLQGYVDYLGAKLGIPLVCTTRRPHIWLSADEKAWVSQVQEKTGKPVKFWLINSGVKQDYTAKHWGHANYQAVVDMLYGRIQFVQIGSKDHLHHPLQNVIDLVGKTDIRQLIRLCWHAQGAIGPVTFLMHLMGAFERPYVCLLGGREPLPWEYYPTTTMMSSIGTLPCCRFGGCWKSRIVAIGDNDEKDKSLCEFPVFGNEVLPKCMTLIPPEDVVRAIEKYYLGGVLSY